MEKIDMPSLVKSTLLGLGLLAGTAIAAHAQSLSALPPASSTHPQAAATQPPNPPTSFYPKPGGGSVWQEGHYQPPADYSANAADHPYSTSIGPKPGAFSSGVDRHYQTSSRDAEPARHPYTAAGVGPRAN